MICLFYGLKSSGALVWSVVFGINPVELQHTSWMLSWYVQYSHVCGLHRFYRSRTWVKHHNHFSTRNFFIAGVQTNGRQSGSWVLSDHDDLKVRQDVDWHRGISLSPGSCVADQPGDSRLQGLRGSTVETSSVRHWVGPDLVIHVESMALHPC